MAAKLAVAQIFAALLCAKLCTSQDSWTFDRSAWPLDRTLFAPMVQISAVAVDASVPGTEIYVGHRNTSLDTVFVFNRAGQLLRSFGNCSVHGMRIQQTPSGLSYLWVADFVDHTIKKYSPDGTLLLQLGTPNIAGPGLKPLQFYVATDIAFDSEQSLYVADGETHPNARVVKLDSQLNVVWAVGGLGNRTGQFADPHSLDVDSFDRVWVADRYNNRIQVLNPSTGAVIAVWMSTCQGNPWSIRVAASLNVLFVADATTGILRVLSLPNTAEVVPRCIIKQELNVSTAALSLPGMHGMSVDDNTGDLYSACVMVPYQAVRFLRSTESSSGISPLGMALAATGIVMFLGLCAMLMWFLNKRRQPRGGYIGF